MLSWFNRLFSRLPMFIWAELAQPLSVSEGDPHDLIDVAKLFFPERFINPHVLSCRREISFEQFAVPTWVVSGPTSLQEQIFCCPADIKTPLDVNLSTVLFSVRPGLAAHPILTLQFCPDAEIL